MGMRKVNTLGIKQANKVMLMAAVASNIKKYLKFTMNRASTMAKEAQLAALYVIDQLLVYITVLQSSKINWRLSCIEIIVVIYGFVGEDILSF
jgi:hypothetical protein